MRRFGGQKTAKAARADGAGPLFLGRVDFFCRRAAVLARKGAISVAERLAWARRGGEFLRGQRWARGVRSHLPPAVLAAREASHPCRLAVILAGPFPYRACCVRVAYSSFSTAVQVPSAAERENGCALIPCAVLAGLSAGQRKIAPHGRRQCRKSCPLLPSIMAELRSSRVG